MGATAGEDLAASERRPTPRRLLAGEVTAGFVCGAIGEAALLEQLGADALWVGGHVASPNPSPEAMVALAQLVASTSRAVVGTAILLLPLYHPVLVAKQVADLDRASGGRVALGIGVGGEYPAEFAALGVPLAGRGRRTDEAVGLLRRLWTGQEVSHTGAEFSVPPVRVHPAPLQDGGPPVVVAGRQEPAMRRAGRLGDGWMPYLYSPGRYDRSVARIRQHAADAGRDLAGFGWCLFVPFAVDRDGARARRTAAEFLGGTYRQDFTELVPRVTAAGTTEEVTARLVEYVAAGARHLVLLACDRRQAVAQAALVLGEVLPEVRRLSGDRPGPTGG
ncbi:MAG: LLM class flavin-dependent oxidoreductase [Acidimicrobiales bacterium]